MRAFVCEVGVCVCLCMLCTMSVCLFICISVLQSGDMSASDIEVLQRELRNPPPVVDYLFTSSAFSSGTCI